MIYVKVKPERDEYGLGTYRVKERNGKGEVLLTHTNGKVPSAGFWIYEAHTFRDRETAQLDMDERSSKKAKAKNIGTGFDKRGRKK